MKRIVYHYTVMRTLEVPDDFPEEIYELEAHIDDIGSVITEYVTSEKTDGCEIITVEDIK